MKLLLTFFYSVLLSLQCFAQVGVAVDTGDGTSTKEINAALTKLQNAILESESHDVIAESYFNLGKSYAAAGELTKAELNFNKAIQESLSGTGKNRALYYRELGRVQERRKSFDPAAVSYRKAAELSTDSVQKKLNLNDAARMKQSSPAVQMVYLNQNAAILSNTTNDYERVQNLNSMANTNVLLNQNPSAIQNYIDALKVIDSTSEEAIDIQSNIVDLYVASSDLPSAIAAQKNLVKEAEGNVSAETQIEELRNLSTLYLKADSTDAAIRILETAYRTAIREQSYHGALESVQQLADLYRAEITVAKADSVLKDFVSRSELLMANDQSLFNRRQLSLNEQRIAELERQQTLQEELLERRNRYNWLLGISVLALSLLAAGIAYAWFSIRKRNRQIALQSLRREMNPHFIFNSLNSVNEFIAGNNERKANQFLTSYSGLMRNIMENSGKDFISLETELDQLKKYLELEKLRFPDKFDYFIDVDPEFQETEMQIPNMLIQPNVENAIWHGLRYKESGGWIRVRFSRRDGKSAVTIEDNGIGLKESARLKTKNQKLYESRGLKNTEERVRLLNEIYGKGIIFTIEDKSEGGTVARIVW